MIRLTFNGEVTLSAIAIQFPDYCGDSSEKPKPFEKTYAIPSPFGRPTKSQDTRSAIPSVLRIGSH